MPPKAGTYVYLITDHRRAPLKILVSQELYLDLMEIGCCEKPSEGWGAAQRVAEVMAKQLTVPVEYEETT